MRGDSHAGCDAARASVVGRYAIPLVVTDKLTDHLTIDSFGWALGGALVMSLVGSLGEWIVRSVLLSA